MRSLFHFFTYPGIKEIVYATTEPQGLCGYFSINIKQITPLGNGDQKICGGLKAKILKLCMEPLWRRDYIVAIPSISNKSPPWKMGTTKFSGEFKANNSKFGVDRCGEEITWLLFNQYQTNHPLGNWETTHSTGIKSQKIKILHGTTKV